MANEIVRPRAVTGSEIQLTPAPIRPEWIVAGAPVARSSELAASPDGDSFTCIWECTAGAFHWNFDCDETVHVLEGQVIVSWQGQSVTLVAGDTAYFPAGSRTLWKVDRYVRKIAFLRLPPPRFVSLPLRAWRRLRRIIGGGSNSSISGVAANRA
jgi:uncharacterized cupin superfamily protein